MSASLHGDVASAIGQQVEQMIFQAKKDSEARVRHDLDVAKSQLRHMEGLVADLSERVARRARAHGQGAPDLSQTVDRAFLSQKIAQLEQKWGSEVKALKQDLHRTILAHNHNSDLMRHHRDALDEARRKLDAQSQPKAEQVDAQIEKVDRILRAGQAKQRALDALTERLTTLEQQVGDLLPSSTMPSPFPGMMPGMPGMLGQQLILPQQREQAATKRKPGGKDGEPPTEEEVRARLLQAARANQMPDGASSFNAEAPVFVPRGAASATEGGALTGSDTAGATALAAAPAAAPAAPVKLEAAASGASAGAAAARAAAGAAAASTAAGVAAAGGAAGGAGGRAAAPGGVVDAGAAAAAAAAAAATPAEGAAGGDGAATAAEEGGSGAAGDGATEAAAAAAAADLAEEEES